MPIQCEKCGGDRFEPTSEKDVYRCTNCGTLWQEFTFKYEYI